MNMLYCKHVPIYKYIPPWAMLQVVIRGIQSNDTIQLLC